MGFNIGFNIVLNNGFNIGVQYLAQCWVQYWAQCWVQYCVQYSDSILGSILGSISVLDVPMNLCIKFHQNRVSNSWDIGNIEFVWWGMGGGVVCKVIFVSNPTLGYVRLSWVVVELGFWQLKGPYNLGSEMCSLLVRSFYKGKGWKKLLKMLLSAWHPPPLVETKLERCTTTPLKILKKNLIVHCLCNNNLYDGGRTQQRQL